MLFTIQQDKKTLEYDTTYLINRIFLLKKEGELMPFTHPHVKCMFFFFCRMQKDTFWIITAHSVFPYNYIKCWAEAFKLNSKNSAKPFFRCKFMSLSETNIACNIVQILYGQFLVHFSGAFAFFFKLESCFFFILHGKERAEHSLRTFKISTFGFQRRKWV